jgi:signal transduction histidine kinase
MQPGEHLVQFYEGDEFLLDALRGYIGAGLKDGEATIVVATPEHRQELERQLTLDGVDVAGARAAGQYLDFDAAETLARISTGGAPDPERFRDVIGGVLGKAGEAGRPVRAFGEMVVILWRAGHRKGALELEELWNGIAGERAFSLLCAYPLSGFGAPGDARCFERVCGHHTRVIPGESYAGTIGDDARLREVARLQQRALALEAELLTREEAERALRERERELSDACGQLEAMNKDLREFAFIVSHDLREPLRGIGNVVAFLETDHEESLDAGARERLRTIRRLTRRSYDLLDAVMALTRVSRDGLHIVEVDASAMFAEAIENTRARIDENGSIVTFEPSGVRLRCDPKLMVEILTNLIANGLKYNQSSPKRVRLACSVIEGESQPVISVQDNGIGIDPRHHERVFHMFKRLHSSDRFGGGTGAGLAIVWKIVERHGGRVWLTSRPGEGSTFFCTLGPDGAGPPAAEGRRA